jgi:ubiquinone/menaquinone biosynthesis C-methylase UbiE
MNDLTDRAYLRGEQYRDGRNLDARIRLHQRFSVATESPNRWMIRQLRPGDAGRVLELGCGPGHFWRDTRDLRPARWRVVCSDLSPGMAAEAARALGGEPGLSFAAADAQALPFPDASFDVVLANFMLYHVPDRPRALAEIRRALRPGGQFAAATVGRSHMAGLRELVLRFVADLPPEAVAQSDHFLLENAAAQLEPFFDDVRLERQPNALEVTEAEPLVDYVQSMWSYREALAGREQAFEAFVADEIAAHGSIRIAKEIGLLTGHKSLHQ